MVRAWMMGLTVTGVVALGAAIPTPGQAADATAAPFVAMPAVPLESQPEAKHLIAVHCERCHPALPEGGWTQMTLVRHDRDGWISVMKRMRDDYQATAGADDRGVIAEYLATHWGPEDQ